MTSEPDPGDDIATATAAPEFAVDAAAAHSVGDRVGRYLLSRRIGRGGMGEVFAAKDPVLDREVAIKLVRADRTRFLGDGHVQLRAEARVIAELSHPNVVGVFDMGELGSEVFIAMELVAGGSLSAWLRARERDWDAIVGAFLQAGRGLAAAHDAGVVHRDFKPSNVLVCTTGRIVVTDFGLARYVCRRSASLARSDSQASGASGGSDGTTSDVAGTPTFMAPEQHRGLAVDGRADQFSFAVALFVALHGRHPFPASTTDGIVERVLQGRIDWPHKRGRWPRGIDRALRRALQADPDARWASMHPLLAMLQESLQPRGRRVGALHGAGLIAVLCGGWLLAPEPDDRDDCEMASTRLTDLWGVELRDGLNDALPEAAAQMVPAAVDRYASAWVAVQRRICADGASALRRTRLRCLERRTDALEATLKLWSERDAEALARAGLMVGELSPPEPCVHAEIGRPEPPMAAAAEAVDEQRVRLAHADALQSAGRFEDALSLVTQSQVAAAELGYLPLSLEADYRVLLLEQRLGKGDPAAMGELALAAEAAGYDDVLLAASTELVFWLGHRRQEFDAAERWWRKAASAIERLGAQESAREAKLLHNVTWLLISRRDKDAALAMAQRTLALREQLFVYDHASLAQSISTLGTAFKQLGRFADAEREHARALAMQRRILGPAHPDLVATLNNLASAMERQGKLAEAETVFNEALEILSASFGDDHPQIAAVAFNLGTVAHARFQHSEALEYYRRAAAGWEAEYGPDHPNLALVMTNLGNLLDEIGQREDALLHHERALELVTLAHGERSELVAGVLANIGRVARHDGKLERSEAALRRAIEIEGEASGDEAIALTEHRTELALTLLESGHEGESRQLLLRAQERYSDTEGNVTTRGLNALALGQLLAAADPARAALMAAQSVDQLSRAGPMYASDLARAQALRDRLPRLNPRGEGSAEIPESR